MPELTRAEIRAINKGAKRAMDEGMTPEDMADLETYIKANAQKYPLIISLMNEIGERNA